MSGDSDKQNTSTAAGMKLLQTLTAGKRKVALGVALAVLVVGAIGVRGFDHYLTGGQAFCLSCHSPAQADLATSSHASLACGECHDAQFGQNATLFAKKLLEGQKANAPHAKANRNRCNVCHLSGENNDHQLNATVGHETHVLRGPRLECVACHGSDSHKLTPKPGVCKDCHKDVRIFHAGTKDLSCLSCHTFLAKTSAARKPAAMGCQLCHGGDAAAEKASKFTEKRKGPEVTSAMVHGNLEACRLCHNPHESDPKKRTTGAACSRCHESMSKTVADLNVPPHKDCTGCHQVHQIRAEVGNACARCHEAARPGSATDTAASKHERCVACHTPHTFSAAKAPCAKCHEDKANRLASWNAKTHANCQNCHKPHEPGSEQKACRSCHTGHAGAGHRNCTNCHDPHGSRADAKQCATCHGGQLAALAAVPSHQNACQKCHPTHAVGGAPGRCASCHDAQANKVSGANPTHTICTSCHKPHGFAATSVVGTCTSCHKLPGGSHKGACNDCHTIHGSPRTAQNSCAKCHENKSTTGKHKDCRSCHRPHRAAAEAGVCSNCHAGPASTAAQWRPAQHKTCSSCHPTHNPDAGAACGRCHSKQTSSVQGGKHTCSSCHSQHQTPGNWWSRCSNCHGAIASQVKSRGQHHSQCQACHKPHKFGKPSCTACHNAMPSMGAHGNAGHNNCSACHPTHAKSNISRSTCVSCHTNKKDHHADTKSCTSCHLFR